MYPRSELVVRFARFFSSNVTAALVANQRRLVGRRSGNSRLTVGFQIGSRSYLLRSASTGFLLVYNPPWKKEHEGQVIHITRSSENYGDTATWYVISTEEDWNEEVVWGSVGVPRYGLGETSGQSRWRRRLRFTTRKVPLSCPKDRRVTRELNALDGSLVPVLLSHHVTNWCEVFSDSAWLYALIKRWPKTKVAFKPYRGMARLNS